MGALAALAVLAGAAAPAMGSEVLARDGHVHDVFALGRTVVYQRVTGRHRPYRFSLFRAIDGHAKRLRHVPSGPYPSALGRDGHGRVVLTLGASTIRHGVVTDRKWWLYDVERRRARRLRSVPSGGCAPDNVSVWWHRVAYSRACAPFTHDGVFLRTRGHTRRAIGFEPEQRPLLLRSHLLAAVMLEADGDTAVWRLTAGGRVCRILIPDSYIDEEWSNHGVWLSGHNLVWSFADSFDLPSDTVMGARLHGCGAPGPTGRYAVPVELPQIPGARAIDGPWIYWSDNANLYRDRLPRAPVTSPPANDDFEHATELAGAVPVSVGDQVIGRATVQPGEPGDAEGVTRTVWYAFRPATTRRVFVTAGYYDLIQVFEGEDPATTTPLPVTRSDGSTTGFDAVAGHEYRISVGCYAAADGQGISAAFKCFEPYELRIGTAPPPF